MKILTSLSAQLAEGDYREPRGVVQSLHLEPVAGAHVRITLGGGGLVIQRGDNKVGIPLSELTRIAFEHVPELILVTDGPAERVAALISKQATAAVTPPAAKPAA